MSELVLDRPIGLHERYCVSRTNLGFPSLVAIVAHLSDEAVDIDILSERIGERIEKLGELLPLLSAHVEEHRTRAPRFARRRGYRLQARDVLIRSCQEPDLNSARLLEREIVECTRSLQLERGPLWRVRICESLHNGVRKAAVILVVHHVICDGRGTANLMQTLLADELPPVEMLTSGLSPDEYPPDSMKDLNMVPGIQFVIDLVWKNLIVPRFPSLLRSWFEGQQRWPAYEPPSSVKPIEAEKRIAVLTFDQPGFVTRFKAVALRHNVKTLNPLVHSASLSALCSILDFEGEAPIHFASETAVSERVIGNEDHRHTFCSGNFVGNPSWNGTLTRDMDFWDTTRSYAQYLSSPQGRIDGRNALGALAYVPDSDKFVPSDARAPTQFDAFLLEKMQSDKPYGKSIALSNLGQLALPPWISDVAWAQNQSPMGSPFYVDACGLAHVEGTRKIDGNVALSISVGYRLGSVGGGREEAFVSALKNAIMLIANDIEEKQTLGQVVSSLREITQE